ncbi:MAG: hypothetical protein AAF417_19885 [Pseudomonadota bacterium]
MTLPLPSSVPAIRVLAEELFENLRADSFDGVGVTRASYDSSETGALALLADAATREHPTLEHDRGGNLIISLAGGRADQPFVACGSHLDSVP